MVKHDLSSSPTDVSLMSEMIAENICEYYLIVKRPIKSEVFVRSVGRNVQKTVLLERNRRVFN